MKNIIVYDLDQTELVYDSFIFSDGAVHVRFEEPEELADCDIVIVTARLINSNEIMRLFQILGALRAAHTTVVLYVYFFPYARQDRVCNPGESFALKVMVDMFQPFRDVIMDMIVADPHSDVLDGLLHPHVHVLPLEEILRAAPRCSLGDIRLDPVMDNADIIISPDGGSLKKCVKLARSFGKPLAFASKVRDTSTGEIVRTEVFAESKDIQDKSVIIIDDICDGGRTFIELAKAIQEMYPRELVLYVTHGIFSKGLDPLFEAGIDRIVTTDSFHADPLTKFYSATSSELKSFEVIDLDELTLSLNTSWLTSGAEQARGLLSAFGRA